MSSTVTPFPAACAEALVAGVVAADVEATVAAAVPLVVVATCDADVVTAFVATDDAGNADDVAVGTATLAAVWLAVDALAPPVTDPPQAASRLTPATPARIGTARNRPRRLSAASSW